MPLLQSQKLGNLSDCLAIRFAVRDERNFCEGEQVWSQREKEPTIKLAERSKDHVGHGGFK
jgi:hypothetical protein